MVKRHDPTTGQEREVEEQVEVDDDNYDEEESDENDQDDDVYSDNNEHDYFPTSSQRPTSAPRGRNTGGVSSAAAGARAIRGSPQRQLHSDQESQEVMMKKFGHGFWGSSSPEHKQRNDNNNNTVFSRLSSPTKRRTASSSK